MRAACLFALVIASGCTSYQPGSFTHARGASPGASATVGCLDVAVAAASDAAAIGPVARIAVANRCDRAVAVDLGAVRASGRASGAADVAYYAFDPRAEIRPAILDGRSVAAESIEYRSVDADRRVTALCFDVSAIANRDHAAEPICIDVGISVAEARR